MGLTFPGNAMKIVCDKNMPYAVEAFGTLGKVMLKDGRQIAADDVRDAELRSRARPRGSTPGCLTAARYASMDRA